ncbi:MAG: hypothetical protein BWY65_02136 [Firmicutes bacterium ADurb.Bin373]|nr:MAG: hypothetical protein BWY65_02136 [Firmicutes bacterium ADurb.Bin373]
MINIRISGDAREYLLSKSSAVTVEGIVMSGCCGITKEPFLFAEAPADPADYDLVIVDGIKVYVTKEAVIGPAGQRAEIQDIIYVLIKGHKESPWRDRASTGCYNYWSHHYSASFSRSMALTTPGLAWPLVAFITWPTKKPMACSLPD